MKNRSKEMKCQVSPIKCHVSGITHQASRSTLHAPRSPLSAAFSLIEIMVTVALLSFIVLGLLAMFTQTKRAFTSSMTQTDVMESGRAVVEMIVRDLEQLTPSHVVGLRGAPNLNFFAEVDTNMVTRDNNGNSLGALLQGMPGTVVGTGQDRRTN